MGIIGQMDNSRRGRIALIGNPNVGKSVLFGLLTGRYASVSNYPGTTVEVATGATRLGGNAAVLLDTPGINTLLPMSEDEKVTRDILLQEGVDAVLQVSDAKNLRRALLISLQLGEMGIPFLLNLNMEDESSSLGISIDKEKLASLLGVPVVGTVAIQKKGIKDLKKNLLSLKVPPQKITYPPEIEAAIRELEPLIPSNHLSRRSLALMVLSGDTSLNPWLRKTLSPDDLRVCKNLLDRFSSSPAQLIHRCRMREAARLAESVTTHAVFGGRRRSRWGDLCTHPIWGSVILVGVLGLFYEFVGKLGAQIAVDWLENALFGEYLNPAATVLFSRLFSFSPLLRDLFVGPFGLVTMALTYALAIIFPIVLTFFIAFSLLEDSGYLPRLAIMLNRIFKVMGLNGKAVVPMVLGLGCDTMATMSARIMDTRKEKVILTLLLALGVPCSAQLGIILAMFGQLPWWAPVVWSVMVLGSLLIVGFLAARLLPGPRADFVMEIPPLRRPTISNIVQKTVARLEWYLKEVVPLFLLATFLLFLLDKLRLLPKIQELANPLVVRLLDLPPQATEAFLMGFLRRDYGATHFFDLYRKGMMDEVQATVSLVVITLFIPCLANLMMIIKERGWRTAVAIIAFIYPFAFLVGGIVNRGLRL